MSHTYYTELWLVTRSDMEKLLELDQQLQEAEPMKERETLNQLLPMYLRYRNIVKRLTICHNQMLQTQKRELIKRVLDCAIGRMLEYKREIVNLEYTDYQWPDDFMNQMKFTPDDVEIITPAGDRVHLEERRKYIQELLESADRPPVAIRERSISQILIESMTDLEESTSKVVPLGRRRRPRPEEATKEILVYQESPEERAAQEARAAAEKEMNNAMLLIQSHERARMSRCVGAHLKRLYDYNKKLETGEIVPKKVDRARQLKAAVTIQRAWKRFAARQAFKKRINRIEEMLDITIPSWKPREVMERDEENRRRRMEMMPSNDARMEKAINEERTRLLRIKGPGIVEDITDEIREWFILWYNKLGYFDVYPAADLGGSVLIATGQTLTPEEFLAEQMAKQKAAEKARKGGKKGGVQSEDKGKEKKEEEKGKGDKKKRRWKMPRTEAFSCLENNNRDFIINWSNRGESKNPQQEEYLDLINEKLCYELQLEMREAVDELMRLELERLNQSLMKDHVSDKEKFVIPTMPKGEKGQAKQPKKRKKKKRDIPEDVTVGDLFNELVQAKIIRNYPLTSIHDWIGDLSYQNHEARHEFRDYRHRLGDVKQLIMEYCILPLSSKEVHRIAPLVRSVCICGLPRSGKTFLTNAICSEVGALIFDMTPHVLLDKYLGKKNEKRLIEIISRVSRTYAPSVIFIEGGEKPWLKRVPTEERYLQPRRFARYYPKLVKSIKPGDQILFLTISSEPYKAARPFLRIHNKFIIIPVTDYNTLYMYYKDLLMKYHGVDRNIDVSCMAKMSVGVPLEFIHQAIEKVLSVRRRITLKFRPLKPEEIIEEVMTYSAPTTKLLSEFKKFEDRTPLGRRRKKLLAAKAAARKKATT